MYTYSKLFVYNETHIGTVELIIVGQSYCDPSILIAPFCYKCVMKISIILPQRLNVSFFFSALINCQHFFSKLNYYDIHVF